MFKEFRDFINKGNVVDLAVAVIIGAAFSAIINSLVADIITPAVLKPVMDRLGVAKIENLVWNGVLIGKFLAAVINFFIVAFLLFWIVRGMHRFNKKEEAKPKAPPAPTKEELLLAEIRDILKEKQ